MEKTGRWARRMALVAFAGLARALLAASPSDSQTDGLSRKEKKQGDARWINTGAEGDARFVNTGEEVFGIGQQQVGNAAPTTYQYSLRRYVVDATPAEVGVVVPIPAAITDAFCKDVDGCRVSISMINWNPATQPGQLATREERLFISQTSEGWRFANTDAEGLDNNASVNELQVFDCFFGDAELSTNNTNGRTDSARGFGILNCFGCTFSDITTTCRTVIED